MRVRSMNTQKAVYYSLLAAYVVFMVAMLLRSQRTDRQLSAIDRRTRQLREMAATGGFDA
ncbi:hypothetical protein BGV91_gp03 [Haloarcula californiae icosahedral virus 1]|uniref:CcmD family protein n=1 Tax=Haloarcula californiae icosahedral virus 1 TaxID=1735722 RepID=A0A1C7A3P6_9VIRU|nr:hypothetical protein BGV91_gp03 [Haloarcula californiae icosahedral virus 1]ALJ99666.1 hypothetical protein SS136_03 [Haloarcula californiae icosahedral virus 1]